MARVALRACALRPQNPGRVYGDPGPVPWWTAPVILDALIPGSMQSHASTAGVPKAP